MDNMKREFESRFRSMEENDGKSSSIPVRVSKKTRDRVENLAAARTTTLSALVRHIIMVALEMLEDDES